MRLSHEGVLFYAMGRGAWQKDGVTLNLEYRIVNERGADSVDLRPWWDKS